MSFQSLRGDVVEIPLELIDEPAVAARVNMDDTQFAELCASIKAHGLIQPVSVKHVGPRYEVLAGHRRLLAHRSLERPTMACVIRDDAHASGELIKAHENKFREELNPAEEAIWLKQLLDTHCGGDIDKLASEVGHPVQYLDRRFDLLRGDEEVFGAVMRGAINASVAAELNRFSSTAAIRSHLDAALSGGATAALVRKWRLGREQLDEHTRQDPHATVDAVGGVAQPADSVCACLLCREARDAHQMILVYMHRDCLLALRKIFRCDIAGIFAETPAGPAPSATSEGAPHV